MTAPKTAGTSSIPGAAPRWRNPALGDSRTTLLWVRPFEAAASGARSEVRGAFRDSGAADRACWRGPLVQRAAPSLRHPCARIITDDAAAWWTLLADMHRISTGAVALFAIRTNWFR